MNILLIDNNDSFTHNLEHLLQACTGRAPEIISYEALSKHELSAYHLAVISPGPGHPREYPDYAWLLERAVPVLGVCLGLQIINLYFGGKVERLPLEKGACVHGKTDRIFFQGRAYNVARYHSLYLSQVADCLDVLVANEQGVPMIARHKERDIMGLQFHPESFLTDAGASFIHYVLRAFRLS